MTQLPPLIIADRTFHSRLLVGTGKFASTQIMQQAGTDCPGSGMRALDQAGSHARSPLFAARSGGNPEGGRNSG